jgi:hypothetical protein
MFSGWVGVFFGEAAAVSYPQQVFLSRCFRGGHFPWWDPAVGAGAVDWSGRFSQAAWYPLNWPFLFLASGSVLDDYFVLYLLPLAAHLVLSFASAFALGRRGFRLSPPASLLLALSWSLSPAFAIQAGRLPAVFSLAWLPAAALGILLFAREGGRGRLLAAVGAAALSGLGGDLPAVFGVFLALAVFGLALAAAALRNGDRAVAGRALFAAFAVIVLGGSLSGLRWAGLPEALRLHRESELVSPAPPVPRLSPAALAGFLLPGLFGSDAGSSLWGPALSLGSRWPSAALPGGVASALLVALGLLSLRRRRGGGAPGVGRFCEPAADDGSPARRAGLPDGRPAAQAWAGVAIFCFIAGALLALLAPGRVPTASPSALLALSWSILLALSFQSLRGSAETISPSRLGKILIVFAAIALLALIWPYRAALGIVFPGFRGLTPRAFPGFLFALTAGLIAAGALGAAARFLPPARRLTAVYLLALAEIIVLAYRGFYGSASPGFPPDDLFGARRRGPSDHPAYRAVSAFTAAFPDGDGRFRRGYFRSAFDNLAWAFDTQSPLGCDLGPLGHRRPAIALDGVCAAGPGEFIPKDWAANFWRNISVRFILTENPLAPPGRPISAGEKVYYGGEIPSPLPRWYFQDRWVVADEERERIALLTFDLRAAGYCPREVWHIRPFAHLYPHPPPLSDAEWKDHFALLQKENRILSVDDSAPNRLVFQLDVKKLSMLVVTDLHHPGWKVRVDDRSKDVHRVNYTQRGVWCRPGRYEIVMEFLPPALGPGLAWTAAGLIGVILIIAASPRRPAVSREP